ncbi:MAG: hypothetical protein FWC36_10975 [Spirochaetes bacterium]|nr:hypothetical protein [Spirochaetota bacterium]
MAQVSVGKEAIRKAEKICNEVIQDLSKSTLRLDQSYKDAGQGWRDQKYNQLGIIVKECTDKLREPKDALFEILEKLVEIYKTLEEYEKVNL